MAISDIDRAIQHNPDQSWPKAVTITLSWEVDGQMHHTQIALLGDQFFGLGAYGAPIEGSALIGMIENARRVGPQIPPLKKVKNARKKR